MKNITLSIGGRSYVVACGPGEEGHIAALGQLIDQRLASNPGLANQSETRTLLYLALLLADELHDQQAAPPAPESPAPESIAADEVAEILENLAERLETLAARLESGD